MQSDFESRIQRIEQKHGPRKEATDYSKPYSRKEEKAAGRAQGLSDPVNKRLLGALSVAILVPSILAYNTTGGKFGDQPQQNRRLSSLATINNTGGGMDPAMAYLKAMSETPQARIAGKIMAAQAEGLSDADRALLSSGGPAAIALKEMEALGDMTDIMKNQ